MKHKFKEIQGGFCKTLAISRSFKECVNPATNWHIITGSLLQTLAITLQYWYDIYHQSH